MKKLKKKIKKLFRRKRRQKPSVTFATCCWENDWKKMLLDPDYLKVRQIENHDYPFNDKMLIINNVKDLKAVTNAAQELIYQRVIDEYIIADEHEEEVLEFFELSRKDFKAGPDAHLYENVTDDWVFYNARGILTALYFCGTDYFLYLTGDSYLQKRVSWIDRAIKWMRKRDGYKVANLTWNDSYREAKKEAYRQRAGFYLSKRGFSDQCFLVKTSDFRAPIYHEVLPEATQYPRGDVLEKRIFSYMRKQDWKRLTYKYGSYTHKNVKA